MFKHRTAVPSKRLTLCSLLSLLLINLISSKIHIWEPKTLKSMYANHDIPYSVMNFGVIPYGHSVYGTVFKASPYDACSELNPLKWDKNYGTLIVLVERGGCNFSEKVINAQRIGAGLVLIADNNNEDVHKIFPVERTKEMLDKVHIPSVLISKADADNYVSAMDAPTNTRPHEGRHGVVELAMHFDLVKVDHESHVRIILQVDDYRSYDLIHDFYALYPKFKSNIDLKIHFKIFFNAGIFFSDDDCLKVNQDSFCVAKTFGNQKKNLGLTEETLKQLCLKNHNIDQFIAYSKAVRRYCFGDDSQIVDDFKGCTKKAFEDHVMTATRKKIEKCMTPDDPENVSALKGNHEEIKYFLINYAPLIFINGFYYKGNFDDISHLYETICNSFETPPQSCYQLESFLDSANLNSVSLMHFISISVIICLSMIFMAIVLFYIVYKRRMRRRFNFELNDKINEALAKYYTENDEEPRKNTVNDYEGYHEEAKGTEETEDSSES